MGRRLGWDDLRFILAVARTGTLSGAARALAVTHSTVFRRLQALERGLGVRLFDRARDGYSPTPAGDAAAALAARVEDEVLSLERRLSGQDLDPSGTVRVTTTDTIGLTILPPQIAALRAAHPQIRVEIAISNSMAALTRRDADVALRPTRDPPQSLIGRRVAGVAYAIYGAPAYLDDHSSPDPSTFD